jgi:hypothetical protein
MNFRILAKSAGLLKPPAWLACCLSVALVLCLTGCNGCVNQDPLVKRQEEDLEKELERKKKEREKKPEEDFTFQEIRVQPNDFMKNRAKINYVKRGHWTTANQQIKANNFDAQADILAVTTNLEGKPYDIEHTTYSLAFSRPAAFPKGQTKSIESLFFLPRESVKTQSVNLRNDLVNVRGGANPLPQSTSILPLDEWQYLFVVLSSRGSSFRILEQTQTFSPYHDDSDTTQAPIRYYQLIRPVLDKTVPLPTNALTWTSVATILWDDIDPTLFDSEQQQALLDWLHWGGLLIVNGPNSMDRLRNSFLDHYLPADHVEATNLNQADFQELNEFWSLKERKKQAPRDLKLVKPLAGLKLQCREDGAFIPHTGSLVAERRVGQGRLVITAFPLNSAVVQNWPNFDGFLNGAILRRPARTFLQKEDMNIGLFQKKVEWVENRLKSFERDARLTSNMRFFSRDITFDSEEQTPVHDLTIPNTHPLGDSSDLAGYVPTPQLSTALNPGDEQDERFGGWLAVPKGGVASWNDFSGAANAARLHVIDAAGIRIPSTDFVLKVLGVYILVLVPLNWLVFRSLGRVEWAWLAAPVIAIVGAMIIVRLAHLDIGFVRSRTEIDVVEIQPGYERAHVSRFINLYTALATFYDLVFEDPTALAQPLPEGVQNYRPFTAKSQVRLHRDTNLSLSGFQVESNSQGMVHVEQMLNLGGKMELLGDDSTGWKLKNGTSLELQDAIILRRTEQGYSTFIIDKLAAGKAKNITFSEAESTIDLAKLTRTSNMLKPVTKEQIFGELRLGRFTKLATENLLLQVGEVRLIAWSAGELPGVTYRPDSAQVNAAAFILAHLRRTGFPQPQRDANVLADIVATSENTTITPDDLETTSEPTP